MDLRIKPFTKNLYPIGGFFIKHPSVLEWTKEIQRLKFSLKTVEVYPLPNTTLNSVWGCFVFTSQNIKIEQIGKNELCQMVSPHFFITEKTMVHPKMTQNEIEKLFSKGKYVLHPEIGFVELSEALNLAAFIVEPKQQMPVITKPLESIFIPQQIKSFQIQPLSPEQILANLEENIFPQKEKMEDTPLDIFEKGRLAFYQMLFSKTKEGNGNVHSSSETTGSWSKIESFINKLLPNSDKLTSKLQQDFEELAKRNQKEVDKLLDLLKNNPNEALKYAIPLDDSGTSRGSNNGQLDLSKRWFDFSLFGNNARSSSSSGGSIDLGDHYYALQNQYNATARALVEQKEYQKAAFVYMKLLKNYVAAAQTLEDGKFYQEAATIYLKHANNKDKAAECYEKGNMITNAIDIYKELGKNEKVGDLYINIGKKKEADIHYEYVVNNFVSKDQYLKASLIYKDKIRNVNAGQSLLLKGWQNNKDAFNCLNNYFENIEDLKILKNEIHSVYRNDLTERNSKTFLHVIQHEFKKENELSESLKEMAYEIVAAQIPNNPKIVSELKVFNTKDEILMRDTILFQVQKNQK